MWRILGCNGFRFKVRDHLRFLPEQPHRFAALAECAARKRDTGCRRATVRDRLNTVRLNQPEALVGHFGAVKEVLAPPGHQRRTDKS